METIANRDNYFQAAILTASHSGRMFSCDGFSSIAYSVNTAPHFLHCNVSTFLGDWNNLDGAAAPTDTVGIVFLESGTA
jgi:hypothetical protein